MRLFHVCAKKEFEKDGERKIKWYKAGIMKINDRGRLYLRLFHQPEVDFHLFESNKEPRMETVQTDNAIEESSLES